MKVPSGLGSIKGFEGGSKLGVVLQRFNAVQVMLARILYSAQLHKYFPFLGKRCTTTYQKV